MKTWLLVGIFAGLLILGGLAVVQALDKSVETQTTDSTTNSGISSPSYSCGGPGSGSCGGGCTGESNCGYAGCAAATGGTCGCGAK